MRLLTLFFLNLIYLGICFEKPQLIISSVTIFIFLYPKKMFFYAKCFMKEIFLITIITIIQALLLNFKSVLFLVESLFSLLAGIISYDSIKNSSSKISLIIIFVALFFRIIFLFISKEQTFFDFSYSLYLKNFKEIYNFFYAIAIIKTIDYFSSDGKVPLFSRKYMSDLIISFFSSSKGVFLLFTFEKVNKFLIFLAAFITFIIYFFYFFDNTILIDSYNSRLMLISDFLGNYQACMFFISCNEMTTTEGVDSFHNIFLDLFWFGGFFGVSLTALITARLYKSFIFTQKNLILIYLLFITIGLAPFYNPRQLFLPYSFIFLFLKFKSHNVYCNKT